jgi:hypothetical protein
MGLKSNNPPLPLGSFIEAEIIGREMQNVFKVPRPALGEENKLLTASEAETLRIKTVSVLWKEQDWVYIDTGMDGKTKIIVSNVPAPVEGMPLQIWQAGESNDSETNNPAAEQSTE